MQHRANRTGKGIRMRTRAIVTLAGRLILLAAPLCVCGVAWGEESPRSYGSVSAVDSPILRVPTTQNPPIIDGAMEPGEWEDASAFSGFWYDYGQADFRFLAPMQTQLQVYSMRDKDNLYIAYSSPVWPEGSWLKAQGRFPDVLEHPLYGTQWDDHCELEIRPYGDVVKGFQLGLLRWDVNPIGTLTDWRWSVQGGRDLGWKSDAKVRCGVTDKRWIIEYAIPLECLPTGNYKGKDENGRPLVTIPPPDGTVYRAWFTRGIGGNGGFFNAFDNHSWNTCKMQLIFDSGAVGFQINELGPIMEDTIDLKLTVKNHNTRSETVRIGFFVENAMDLIYSSYESPELNGGLLELRPGEVRQLRLRKAMPGITTDGNVLWFDVRSAGTPAKTLFRTRLIRFHSMEGGAVYKPGGRAQDPVTKEFTGEIIESRMIPFMERRVDVIKVLRPPREDFKFQWDVSSYTKRLSAVVDVGGYGASDEAKTAAEAVLIIARNDAGESEVKRVRIPFHRTFAAAVADVSDLLEGESYRLTLLLFDPNQRIVGDRNAGVFTYRGQVWKGNNFGNDSADLLWEQQWKDNPMGKDDVVPEGYEAMRADGNGFETVKHRFTLGPAGLPAQIRIKADPRDLPLEKRAAGAAVSGAELLELGRGDQLREPMRLEAEVGGKRLSAEAAAPMKLVRQWKSELEYACPLRIGPLEAELKVRYDCDGSMNATLVYGADAPVKVDKLELVMPVDGPVDMAGSDTGTGGMAGSDKWECSLPEGTGVVWDSSDRKMELRRGRFVPVFWFGSGDRLFSWLCGNDEGWLIDDTTSTMSLERDAAGKVTWRVQFVNHPVEVKGRRTIDFVIQTHPTRPKPKDWRLYAWHYFPSPHGRPGPKTTSMQCSENELEKRWRNVAWPPKDWPEEKKNQWRRDDPPHMSAVSFRKWNGGVDGVSWAAEMDAICEDIMTFWSGRAVSIGRAVGWWQDECWPMFGGPSANLAMGNAYLRDPDTVADDELPWQGCFPTRLREYYKRLAKIHVASNVPQRQYTWANNAATFYEMGIHHCMLVEDCGAQDIRRFPNSIYRYMAHNWSGVIACLGHDGGTGPAGSSKMPDRLYLGTSLLHDIGSRLYSAHGSYAHREIPVRMLNALAGFGFFEDADIEKVPFWRIEPYVKMGDTPPAESSAYVTVYRRPLEGGGCKALFVIQNQSSKDIELPLRILEPRRILGGPNTLKAAEVRKGRPSSEAVGAWLAERAKRDAGEVVMKDLETGDVIAPVPGQTETYGPVYVPEWGFRVLYAESKGGAQ